MALQHGQFTHQGLWDVYNGKHPTSPAAPEQRRCRRILGALAAAQSPADMRVAGYPLSSNSARYTIQVSASHSISVDWSGALPRDIDYV